MRFRLGLRFWVRVNRVKVRVRVKVHLEAHGGGEGHAVEGSDHIRALKRDATLVQGRGVDADIRVIHA